MAGLNVAAMMNSVGPQSWLGAVTRRILDLAFLEDDLDGADERVHRQIEVARQARLVMCSLERLP